MSGASGAAGASAASPVAPAENAGGKDPRLLPSSINIDRGSISIFREISPPPPCWLLGGNFGKRKGKLKDNKKDGR